MRSLRECYEVAKKYHSYWAGGGHYRFMCLAAGEACRYQDLTYEELVMLREDIKSLLHAIDPEATSLMKALGKPTDKEVKDYWDRYINSMENQDG